MLSKWRSNPWLRLALGGLCVLVLVQCSYFFNEKPDEKVVKLDRGQGGVGNCLAQSGDVVNQYFEGDPEDTLLDHNIQELTDCYNDMLTLFVKHTKSGDVNSQVLSSEQVLAYFDKSYPDHRFSIQTIKDGMALKSFFIGGSKKELTYEEISKAKAYVKMIGRGFLELRPFRKIFSEEAAVERSDTGVKTVFQAYQTLKDLLQETLVLIEANKQKESVLDLQVAARLALDVSKPEDRDGESRFFQLLISMKRLLLNENHDEVSFQNMRRLVSQSVDTYYSLLQYKQLVSDKYVFSNLSTVVTFPTGVGALLEGSDVLKTVTGEVVSDILDRSLTILREAIEGSPKDFLDPVLIEDLINHLEENGKLGEKLSGKTLTRFVFKMAEEWLFDKNFSGAEWSVGKIQDVRSQYFKFMDRLKFINAHFDDHERVLPKSLMALRPSKETKSWLKIIESVTLKSWSKQNRLYFAKARTHPILSEGITYRDAVVSSAIYSQIEFFARKYQDSTALIETYSLSQEQAQEVYEFLRLLGLELKIMDSRIFDTGIRAFMEANNFTTRKQNDSRLDFMETFEVLSVMYTADKISNQLYEGIDDQCKNENTDVLGKALIDPECYRTFFSENFSKYFSQLGSVAEYWGLKSTDRLEFMKFLERSAREGVYHDERDISMGEVRTMVAIAYYLESVLYNFDTEAPFGIITGNEVPPVQEHFRSFIEDFVFYLYPQLKDSSVLYETIPYGGGAVVKFLLAEKFEAYLDNHVGNMTLAYILDNRKIPSNIMSKEGRDDFAGWWWNRYYGDESPWENLTVQISPMDMVSVFSIIGNSTRLKTIESVRSFLASDSQQFLIQELSLLDEAPACPNTRSRFCEFVSLANCSFDAHSQFFGWLKTKHQELFRAGDDPVLRLSKQMNKNEVFSTQCMFPHVNFTPQDNEHEDAESVDEGN